MSGNEEFEPIVGEIDRVLRDADYLRVENLRIGTVPFEVDYAYVAGQGFLDLVVVMDAAAKSSRIYWLAERVASALDTVGSRRPVTYVLVGSHQDEGMLVDDLIRLGRVVHVSALELVPEELAPLLPVVIEQGDDVQVDPLTELDVSTGTRETDISAMRDLVRAARSGAAPVEASLAQWLDGAFGAQGREDA